MFRRYECASEGLVDGDGQAEFVRLLCNRQEKTSRSVERIGATQTLPSANTL